MQAAGRLRKLKKGDLGMQIANFKEMYIAELQELVSMEGQVGEALKRAAELASHASLKDLFKKHRLETLQQADQVRSILEKHGGNAQAHTDQAMQALIAEADKMAGILKGNDLRDVGLIASAQKLEHYEIAALAAPPLSLGSSTSETIKSSCTRSSRKNGEQTSD